MAFRLTATVILTRSTDEYSYRERVTLFDSRVGIEDTCDKSNFAMCEIIAGGGGFEPPSESPR